MRRNYQGMHRAPMTRRPACTCEAGTIMGFTAERNTVTLPWDRHQTACAIYLEVQQRLLLGTGGTR